MKNLAEFNSNSTQTFKDMPTIVGASVCEIAIFTTLKFLYFKSKMKMNLIKKQFELLFVIELPKQKSFLQPDKQESGISFEAT